MSDKKIMNIIGVIGIILMLLYAIGKPIEHNLTNEHTYNHGVCTECGGKYKVVSITKELSNINGNSHYYYKCDSCDKIIEIIK